ncbi:MAG: acetyl-CoA acetyltransferase [Pseudomonadota bacterium]|nr:acetyl-CoA acetyltransferase [Pseudomonadota bacterium]
MSHALRGAAAIVGIGATRFGELPGRTHTENMSEAVHLALADAGLSKDRIDGVFGADFADSMVGLSMTEYLGLNPKYIDSTNLGGSSFVNFLQSAALALHAGLCDVALIAYGSNARTGGRAGRGPGSVPYETVYKPRQPINAYALAASRHMHEYGTTREQLAEVAVAARGWAQLNPAAFMRDPLTIDDVLGARPVVDPFTVRDCCLVTDAGAAMIMVAADRAKDFPQKPAYLLGIGTATTHSQIACMPDLTVTAVAQSSPRALAMAEITLGDVDVVELYDAFTINTILFLEDMGFCPKGEGGRFVQDGRIAPGGELPVNTNGGGLSCVHPGMYGMFLTLEAVEQLRGQAGERQIAGAEIALCNGNGGLLSSQVTAVLGAESTL